MDISHTVTNKSNLDDGSRPYSKSLIEPPRTKSYPNRSPYFDKRRVTEISPDVTT